MIVKSDNLLQVSTELTLLVCWMDTKPLIAGNKYLFQINSRVVRSIVKNIEYKLDVNTLKKLFAPEVVSLNDVIKVTLKLASPVASDAYKKLRANGSGILIDETSNVTVGACMIQ